MNATFRLPHSFIDNVDKAFLLRLLFIERIRCYLDNIDFQESRKEIVKKYTKVPEVHKEPEEKARYLQSELIEMISLYDRYEQDPLLIADFESIKPYQGHRWELISASEHAVLIMIEV